MYDNFAELYAIIVKATEKVELDCQKLIAHFKILAYTASASTLAAIVAECVQNFITAMDSLKLNMVAVDQVNPLFSDLLASLNKLTILPPDFDGKTKMKEWIAAGT